MPETNFFKDLMEAFLHKHKHYIESNFNDMFNMLLKGSPPLVAQLPHRLREELNTNLSICSNIVHCCKKGDMTSDDFFQVLSISEDIFKCLVILGRNVGNAEFFSSSNIVKYSIDIATICVEWICSSNPAMTYTGTCKSIIKHISFFLQCLYDPHFVWQNQLQGLTVGKSDCLSRPSFLHVEIVPFLYQSLQASSLSCDIQMCLLHIFGAIICGNQDNSLNAITPATLDMLLKVMAPTVLESDSESSQIQHFTFQDQAVDLRKVASRCVVYMVHCLHASSPHQRQVEVSDVIQGYMNVLLSQNIGTIQSTLSRCYMSMFDVFTEILTCNDKPLMQVLIVSSHAIDGFISFLENMTVTGHEAQQFATKIVSIVSAILSGCSRAKAIFESKNGYQHFVDALKSLGQPSMDLLEALLELVKDSQETFSRRSSINVNAALLLLQWLPDILCIDTQAWLAKQLFDVCVHGQHSRINCCSSGMIGCICDLLKHHKQMHLRTAGHLFDLMENLGNFSISASELKCLMGIFTIQCPNQIMYTNLLMRVIESMAHDEGKGAALNFFNLENPHDCIILPSFRKWPGPAFSFHAWICLDNEIDLRQHFLPGHDSFRRQIYIFNNQHNCGMEVFVTPAYNLVVAVFNKKEYCCLSIINTGLQDGLWHSLGIVHTPSWRPFVPSSVAVYVDGKQLSDSAFKFPDLNNQFSTCRVGSPCPNRNRNTDVDEISEEAKRKHFNIPVKNLFANFSKLSTVVSATGIIVLPYGSQDNYWGYPITMHGRISSISLFNDVILASQFIAFHQSGPNDLTAFSRQNMADISSKLVARYCAKASIDQICKDLSPMQNHGHFCGQMCISWDIRDAINSIGGVQVLFPILEQINALSANHQSDELSPTQPSLCITDEDQLVHDCAVIRVNHGKQNMVAQFLQLFHHFLHLKPINQNNFISTHGSSTIGALLQEVDPIFIDVSVLMAVQLLLESSLASNKLLYDHILQYILLDFRIWNKSKFLVQIGHIQFINTIVKDDRKYFRKTYGVQFVLDTIRSFYSSSDCYHLSEEDKKTIRVSLFNLIKFYIVKHVTAEEICYIISFLVAVKQEQMILECLDLLLVLLDRHGKKYDQLYALLLEPAQAEMLYVLLTYQQYSVNFYEKVVKVLWILLKTDRVYDRSKHGLRLEDSGHFGFINMMRGYDVSVKMIKHFIEQVSCIGTIQSCNSVLAVMSLAHTCDLDIKLEASEQLLSILSVRDENSAARNFAKLLAWQQILVKFLILVEKSGHYCNEIPVLTKLPLSNDLQNPLQTLADARSHKVKPRNVFDADVMLNGHRRNTPQHSLIIDPLPDSMSRSEQSCQLASQADSSQLTSGSLQINSEINSPQHMNINPMTVSLADDRFDRKGEKQANCDHYSVLIMDDFCAKGDNCNGGQEHYGAALSMGDCLVNPKLEKPLSDMITDRLQQECPEQSERLCCNILSCLVTIMWKGLSGSDKSVWKERGQVFVCINKVSRMYNLTEPRLVLRRRLLEMMLQSCIDDMKESVEVQQVPAHLENAIQLVKIVWGFITKEADNNGHAFSETLLNRLIVLLNILDVWDTEMSHGWKDMVYLGFHILLTFASQSDLSLCSAASVMLTTLVQTKMISSSAEASFILGFLHDTVVKVVTDDSPNYVYLMNVMKALISKAHTLLGIDHLLPHLIELAASPSFFDYFRSYCTTDNWLSLMASYIRPQYVHFMESNFGDTSAELNTFWMECQEAAEITFHKHNRDIVESKLKVESQVFDVCNVKVSTELQRFQNLLTQGRNQHNSVLSQWKSEKNFFTGERGAWMDLTRHSKVTHWKLSNQENFSRMHIKMVPNYSFNSHMDASQERDNTGRRPDVNSVSVDNIQVGKEALVTDIDITDDDALEYDDWCVINASSTNTVPYTGKEKLEISEDAELITVIDVTKGRLEVSTTHIYFFSCCLNKVEDADDFKWSLKQLREIHLRRYDLRRSALEIFLIDHTNYFINFPKKNIRNRVYNRILQLRPPNLIHYGSCSPSELLKASNLMQKWVHREISNFEYLMQLNTLAGRTFNDLSQYPVFPWILCDYVSEKLNLDDPNVFRDLSKPIGIVNPENVEEVKNKYEMFEDPTGTVQKFHYGTHYSNAAGVMHYMVRLEPFTTLHIRLQSGKFDLADRQFHSIPMTWKCLMDNPNDVKELIPEFFYLPEFLQNLDGFDLGNLQVSKEKINDVILPNWAKTPEEFIFKHRQALESEHVSCNLNHWIDLIFGYKQKGSAAVKACNVFYYVTYEGAIDLDALKNPHERASLEGMINNFGQTPTQLLKVPHPKRMLLHEAVSRSLKIGRPISIFHFLSDLKTSFVSVSTDDDPLIFVDMPSSQTKSILQKGMPDNLMACVVAIKITVTESGVIGVHGWLPFHKNVRYYYTFEKDVSMTSNRTMRRLSGTFAPGLILRPHLFILTNDSRLLITGGYWDNSVQAYRLDKSEVVTHNIRHIDVVTCLALDRCGRHFITGSRDTTCMVWEIMQQAGLCQSVCQDPVITLFGHDKEVTAVHISTELDMTVSASEDGTIIIHTVRCGQYIRTLTPQCDAHSILSIPAIVVSDMGQIILYSSEISCLDNTVKHMLHHYSVNGKYISSRQLLASVSHMITADDYLVLGHADGQIVIYQTFGLQPLTSLHMLSHIWCISMTNGNSHIMVGLQDGKLIIIGVKGKPE